MPHQVHARPVGEQVAQQALEQGGIAGQYFSGHRQQQFEPDQDRQVFVGRRREIHRRRIGHHPHDRVDNQLADPENAERQHRAERAEQDHGDRVTPMGVPDQRQQPGQPAGGAESLAPARWDFGRLRRAAAAAGGAGHRL